MDKDDGAAPHILSCRSSQLASRRLPPLSANRRRSSSNAAVGNSSGRDDDRVLGDLLRSVRLSVARMDEWFGHVAHS